MNKATKNWIIYKSLKPEMMFHEQYHKYFKVDDYKRYIYNNTCPDCDVNYDVSNKKKIRLIFSIISNYGCDCWAKIHWLQFLLRLNIEYNIYYEAKKSLIRILATFGYRHIWHNKYPGNRMRHAVINVDNYKRVKLLEGDKVYEYIGDYPVGWLTFTGKSDYERFKIIKDLMWVM